MEKVESIGKRKVRESITANHRGRGRTDAEKKIVYAEYAKRKKIVLEAEKRNSRHLVLFLASDGPDKKEENRIYNMGGVSALIYAMDIAPRIGRKNVNINPDNDPVDVRFKDGMTSIRDLGAFTEKLEKIGIFKDEKYCNELIAYFKLNRAYEKSEIDAMRKKYEDDIKRMNEIIYADVVYPDIYKDLINLRKGVYYKAKAIKRDDREILINYILDPVFLLSDAYTLMAHGDMEVDAALTEMQKTLDIMMDRLLMLSDMGLVTVAATSSLGMTMAGMKKKIKEKTLKNEAKKQK